jgi:hypothetical protein
MPTATLGETVDIVYAMRCLVSDEAQSIAGKTLVVGGGQTLPEPILALAQGVSPVRSRRGHSDDGCATLLPDAWFGRGARAADCPGGYHERVRSRRTERLTDTIHSDPLRPQHPLRASVASSWCRRMVQPRRKAAALHDWQLRKYAPTIPRAVTVAGRLVTSLGVRLGPL